MRPPAASESVLSGRYIFNVFLNFKILVLLSYVSKVIMYATVLRSIHRVTVIVQPLAQLHTLADVKIESIRSPFMPENVKIDTLVSRLVFNTK